MQHSCARDGRLDAYLMGRVKWPFDNPTKKTRSLLCIVDSDVHVSAELRSPLRGHHCAGAGVIGRGSIEVDEAKPHQGRADCIRSSGLSLSAQARGALGFKSYRCSWSGAGLLVLFSLCRIVSGGVLLVHRVLRGSMSKMPASKPNSNKRASTKLRKSDPLNRVRAI